MLIYATIATPPPPQMISSSSSFNLKETLSVLSTDFLMRAKKELTWKRDKKVLLLSELNRPLINFRPLRSFQLLYFRLMTIAFPLPRNLKPFATARPWLIMRSLLLFLEIYVCAFHDWSKKLLANVTASARNPIHQ